MRDLWRRAGAHPFAVPALMSLLICLIGANVALSTQIPSWGNDEAPHLGYVVALAHGHLPTIDSPIVRSWADYPPGSFGLVGWDGAHMDIWTANHPPLYHAMLVPLWWIFGGDLTHAVISMRLANTAGYGLWVLLVGLIARDLVPRRPAVVALATVIAVTPTLALRAGYLMNDGWGCAAALLMMLMTIRMLRGGPGAITNRRIAVAAAAGVLAAGTRAPGVLVVAVCCLTLLLCLGRTRRGLLAAVVTGGVPALATGWFYLRNLHLYGDLTGQEALIEKFQRVPVTSLSGIGGVPGLWEPLVAAWIPLVVFLTVVPYVVVRRVRAGAIGPGWRPDPSWTMLVVNAGLTGANIIGFIRIGGGFHDRYLMTVMPLFATLAALAMLSVRRRPLRAVGERSIHFERREWRIAGMWATAMLAWFVVAIAYQEWYFVYRPQGHNLVGGPVPALLLVAAAVVGVLTLVVMARRASPAVTEPVPVSEPVRGAA
ncbi:hypothetical protein [Nocardioides mangrovi]|uniref:Glycosyltransferase RgtA/B/C/D-like domain-containing protein n=1 Tax=Nocardioides mangrovi TaxID=2874580 RepID=A0ABS7U9I7_9ACTN|nr:hypothetical protein [Nocardioides mangrovi]MBZ5737492.1 hypothetical protein [Nocardioides mangrovi]